MELSYIHILTILFKHQYFGDNLFRSIIISFEKETLTYIRNLNIIVKSFPGGMHLLAAEPELFETQDEIKSLQLLFNSKDTLFINYTELPLFQPKTDLLYINNLAVNIKSKEPFSLLHESDFVAQNEITSASPGKIFIPEYDKNKNYVFTDALGNEISANNIRQSRPDSSEFFLSHFTDGLIYVKSENKEVTKTFCYTNPVWRKPLGILELYPGILYKHFKENGKLTYIVNFNNRKTIWKYYLVDPVYQKFKNLSIINKSKEQVFNIPDKKPFFDEREALVFESKNKIPLSELSNNTFQLVDGYETKQKSGKVIVKNLPNASADSLYRNETKSNETIYSHIFI